jgi:hypothetical protein
LKDADSKDHNYFAGAPLALVFPEIDGVNVKTAIFCYFLDTKLYKESIFIKMYFSNDKIFQISQNHKF